MDGKTRSDLGKVISGFESRLESLLARGEAWLSVALPHLLRGRRHQWETLSRQTEQKLQQLDELQQQLGQAVVNIPPEASPEKVLEDASIARSHLQSGGKWRHFFLIASEALKGPNPREAQAIDIADGLCRIVEVEGPMIVKRTYDIYLRGLGIKRLGGELRDALDRGLAHAQRNKRLINDNETGGDGQLGCVTRLSGTPAVRLRQRGPRDFTEIPPAEIRRAALLLATQTNLEPGSEAHLRATLDFFDLKRMTAKVKTRLLEILSPPDSA